MFWNLWSDISKPIACNSVIANPYDRTGIDFCDYDETADVLLLKCVRLFINVIDSIQNYLFQPHLTSLTSPLAATHLQWNQHLEDCHT